MNGERMSGLALRLVVFASPLVVLACTSFAGHATPPIVIIPTMALTGWCVRQPDSQLGLAVVLLVGLDWVLQVERSTTPWSIAAAAGLALFHVSMSMAAVVPPGAALTRSIVRRWTLRWLAVVAGAALTWGAAAVVGSVDVDGGPVLLAGSLATLAAGAVWIVSHSLGRPQRSTRRAAATERAAGRST